MENNIVYWAVEVDSRIPFCSIKNNIFYNLEDQPDGIFIENKLYKSKTDKEPIAVIEGNFLNFISPFAQFEITTEQPE